MIPPVERSAIVRYGAAVLITGCRSDADAGSAGFVRAGNSRGTKGVEAA